jgi:S1-C subfamily serine protease
MSVLLRSLNSELAQLAARAQRSLVHVTGGRSSGGAGVVLHPDGLILTNAHVVRRRKLWVTLEDGRRLAARRLAFDADYDLAALSVEAADLPSMPMGDSRELRAGDWVMALGHPWGVRGAATAGVVIDVGVPPEMTRMRRELVQVGLHLRPGHSGGPLLDRSGDLVGVSTMMAGPNVGLAVPVHVAKRFLRRELGSSFSAVANV